MSAQIETMFYTRETPWHGLGTRVEEAPSSADAIRLAGLDWHVNQKELLLDDGTRVPDCMANVRETDGRVLGVVGSRYRVVQNADAFAFTDDLIGGEVRYETAGSLNDGRRVWLLAKLPTTELAGDEVEPYVCFTNSHDGTGGVKVVMTPVRVVCSNTLNVALSTAKRSWSMRHTESITDRLKEARNCLGLANLYMRNLSAFADEAARTPFGEEQVERMLDEVFPVYPHSPEKTVKNRKKCREEFYVCYFAPDLENLRGTVWGVLNAMSDFATHVPPLKQTARFAENNFGRLLDGHPLIDKAAAIAMRG